MIIQKGNTVSITDFGGIGTGVNPSAQVLAAADTLQFEGQGLDAKNLLLAQQGNDLVLSFTGDASTQVTLKNFKLENLDNLTQATGASVNFANILFNGQSSVQDSFDVFNADSTQSLIWNRNSVTFLNSLNNSVKGFDNSDDVIDGGAGNDRIEGLSGNDLLRGGLGNDTLVSGFGLDMLTGGLGKDRFILAKGEGTDTITDFTHGEDLIALEGLSYDQLTLTASADGKDTLVNVKSTGEVLTILKGLKPNAVSESDFVTQVHPKVVLISLDGATPRFVDQYLNSGALSQTEGLGLLKNLGVSAQQNITITPALTAPGHVALTTGSTAANNNINSNFFYLVASPFGIGISGFGAPIGGYSVDHPGEGSEPTANPFWLAARENGKTVIAATFTGADGVDVRIPGLPNSPIIQPASERTVDYTVPFGASSGLAAKGFSLTASDFSAAPGTTVGQLTAAGKVSYSPVLQKTTALDSFTVGGVAYSIQVGALDTTNDGKVDYDTLVFFDATQGIEAEPFNLPSTGPAYVKASDNKSSRFYLEGSSEKSGTGFYVSNLAPDLSTVRIARYSANHIPRNPAVIADVDDINNNVGFWANDPDFNIAGQTGAGFDQFPSIELGSIYMDQVITFTDYQTKLALRALTQNPTADVGLFYFDQPDTTEHQFLLIDPRQASDPSNPATIGAAQDQEKVARYQTYVQTAYQAASNAVQQIINAVGTDVNGVPNSNIIVVSDHGFDPFFTAVDINNLLRNSGIPALADTNKVRAVSSGPAVNIYINLQGREPNGTVTPTEYLTLQKQIEEVLKASADTNPNYTAGKASVPVFDKIYSRPAQLSDADFGLETSEFIGQDTGDIFGILTTGYNFGATQRPAVPRLDDAPSTESVFSVPNFYGAHGYDSNLPNMSAIFYAAGPDFGHGSLAQVRNIDIAPTILQLIDTQPAATVQGQPINRFLPR